MTDLASLQAFCEWQAHRLRLQLGSDAPLRVFVAAARPSAARRYIQARRGPYLPVQPHGTVAKYNHGKCRCGVCRRAKQAYYAAYRNG